jgi:hypothetical protein
VFEIVVFNPPHMGLPAKKVLTRVGKAMATVRMYSYADALKHQLNLVEKKPIATIL